MTLSYETADMELFFDSADITITEELYLTSGAQDERLLFNCELYNVMYGTDFYSGTNVSPENRRFFQEVTVYDLVHDGVKMEPFVIIE